MRGTHSLFRNSWSDGRNVSEHSGVRISILTAKLWFITPILSENAEVKWLAQGVTAQHQQRWDLAPSWLQFQGVPVYPSIHSCPLRKALLQQCALLTVLKHNLGLKHICSGYLGINSLMMPRATLLRWNLQFPVHCGLHHSQMSSAHEKVEN